MGAFGLFPGADATSLKTGKYGVARPQIFQQKTISAPPTFIWLRRRCVVALEVAYSAMGDDKALFPWSSSRRVPSKRGTA